MKSRRSKGTLGVGRRTAPKALDRARLMKKGLEDHPALFSAPNPSVPVFADQIDTTEVAQVLARRGGMGTAAARDVQLGLLVGMMDSELLYIQSVADSGTPDEAISTLKAGGVAIVAFPKRDKPVLGVTPGSAPGEVVLAANARALLGDKRGHKHCFSWEYTTDGGQTFHAAPTTPAAMTTISGLTPLTKVGFRVAVTVTKGGTSGWSPVVYLVIP
jgi:hypothetical protein